MKEKEEKRDPNLDIPSEANTKKHINFLHVEEESQRDQNNNRRDEFSEQRQKQWREGIAQGKKETEKDEDGH